MEPLTVLWKEPMEVQPEESIHVIVMMDAIPMDVIKDPVMMGPNGNR